MREHFRGFRAVVLCFAAVIAKEKGCEERSDNQGASSLVINQLFSMNEVNFDFAFEVLDKGDAG